MITGTVPVKVPEKLSELELDAGGKRIDNLGLGDTPDDVMRRSEKTGSYEVYGLLAVGLAANRPAPGIVDRLYFSTDTLVLERDTGAAWVEVVRGEEAIRLAQLAERAHTSLTGIGVADHHARYTDVEAAAVANALLVIHAAIAAAHHAKTTDAAEIVSGTFPVVRGGTGLSTIALGGILYASALDVLSRLAPTAANQVLRSTAANALQFATLLAADIPNLDASKITSGVFVLARIPNMDWAHISGLFPRTIADILSDHNLANHPLAIIPVMDDGHIPNLETLSYGGAFAVAQIPSLPASRITSGQFPLSRMPRAASGLFLEGNGAADPIYNALIAANIPNLDASKITSGVFILARIPNMDWAHISGVFPRTIADILSNHNLANHPLAIIPTMDWAHISGLFPRTIAALLSDHNLAHHALGTIVPHDALASLTEKAHGSLTGVTASQHHTKYVHPTTGTCPQDPKAHNQDASTITTGRFPMTRMSDMALNKIMVGQGAGNSPVEESKPTGIPSGLIAMWHGTIATIPAGWVICDGNNSTPNLLTRFIEGVATAATNPGATGGATAKTTAGHIHTQPTHTHTYTPTAMAVNMESGTYSVPARSIQATTDAGGGDNVHSHTDSITDIRPLFYDVAFIMKT